jgi:hypothetical protein
MLVLYGIVRVFCQLCKPDLSTAVLSKQMTVNILQITSSYRLLREKLIISIPKKRIQTADAFKKLVVDHFNKNVFLSLMKRHTKI